MRLKTKIILISCTSILFSLAVCSVVVYSLVRNISFDAAEGQSFKNAITAFSKLEDSIDSLNSRMEESIDNTIMQYILKRQNDEMLVCFSAAEQEEIFNSTVLKYKDFEALHYNPSSDSSMELAQMEVAQMKWENRHFSVYRQTGNGAYVFYHLEDITYVWERMRMLALGLLLLTVVITLFVCAWLFFILNKVLHPLLSLNESAKQIAKGQYDERITVDRRDEIGELSDNFNQMAEAVQLRIRELKEEEEKRTLFMGNLTHELKTPMTAISGYAKTLLTVKLPEEDKEEALSYIYEESCRLERLSKKMMNLLLLEGTGQITLEEVSASVLFRNVAEAMRRNLSEDGIRLECRDNQESFFVDSDLFTEVLINLVDNARKASKRGDTIILSATDKLIEVRDFGRGIPEEEKERILEPFYMIDKSRSRKSGGAGLGLAITAIILKRHNCNLRIESQVGEGTRMILQFV